MKVYTVNCWLYESPEGVRYFATLKEALEDAKRITCDSDSEAKITHDEIIPGRAGLIAALNQTGWRDSKLIAVVNNGQVQRVKT